MDFSVIIPARYQSSRFPGKPLSLILGKPLIIRVIENLLKSIDKKKIYVATDDERINMLVSDFGYNSIMTSNSCLTGTDRLFESLHKIESNIIINVQGDEPLIDSEDIIKCYELKKKYPNAVINAYSELDKSEDPLNSNIPKVIINENHDLIYMSRSKIPGQKDKKLIQPNYLKQICIYGFDKNQLEKFYNFKRKSYLEKYEDIEILRFLELGIQIKMFEASKTSIAIDIPDDIIKVERELKKLKIN